MTISPGHRFTADDVGRFFTTNGTDCWRLVGYQSQPSVIVENVETKERRVGAVDSLNVDGFVRLVQEYALPAPCDKCGLSGPVKEPPPYAGVLRCKACGRVTGGGGAGR